MLVSLLSSQTLVTTHVIVASTKTRAVDVRGFNYANVTLNVRDIVQLSGSPGVTLVANAEASIDGSGWVNITDLTPDTTTIGVVSDGAYVLYPWLRFDVQLSLTGSSAGDQAAVVFCLQCNLRER